MGEILQQDIQQLLEYFAKNLYRAKECEIGDEIVQKCNALMRADYSVIEISNSNGELSAHYPGKLLIPEQEIRQPNTVPANPTSSTFTRASSDPPVATKSSKDSGADTKPISTSTASSTRDPLVVDGRLDAQRLRYLIWRARLARCRARFPLPVILFRGKYICRSATLSGGPEIYGRSGLEYFAYAAEATPPEPGDEAYDDEQDSLSDEPDTKDWPLFGRLRRKDIRLLKALNVGTIIDFMVENKKVKFWLNVTSSEKVDKENRYSFFKILALPYPGCEFFREYRDNDCRGEGLIFDWNQSYVDAGIRVPDDSVTSQLNIDWNNYKQWDLVKITQNYLRLLLKYLQEGNNGILVHCISGWDRTPLFVSLLRISLWADGAIHQTLNAAQLLYFTIAYDWLLFGHNLPDRLNKGEVIFYFCFYILKYIVDDEFSVLTHRFRSQLSSSGSSSIGVIRTDSESMLDGMLFDGESRGSSISLNSTSSFASGRSSSMHDTQTCVINAGIGLTSGGASNSIAISGARNGSVPRNVANTSGGNCTGEDGVNSFNGTSPVTVPSANRLRQRQESTSSLSVGSWQMITCTGSFRSAESVNEIQSHLQQNFCSRFHHPTVSHQGGMHPNNYSNSSQHHQQLHQPQCQTVFQSESGTTPNANQHHHPQHLHHNNHHHQPQQHHHHSHLNAPANSLFFTSQDSTGGCCSVLEDDCYHPNQVDLYALRREKLTQLRTLFYNCYFSTIAFKFNSGPDSGLGSLLGNFAEKVGLASRTSV
ncbi:myotubularin-related protein 14 isoform X2 [Uranotaenia lowii]|uniref:myotubularin-related protein 14 isoform X2 n=1 Tax=Uranotaenia lowii TaxID=190385 RepID=UPI00247AC42D|nr:myotubularin-related protein 14 isoform X2 [Uranotaenia lowii]